MDRLEEIKTLRDDAGFYKNITIHDKATEQVDWLISEIERLKKEREWLLDNMVYEKEDRDWLEKCMQQALKEG